MSAAGSPSSPPDTWRALRGAWVNKQGTILVQQSDQTAQIVYGSTGWQTQDVRTTVLWSTGAAGLILRYASSNQGYYSFTVYPQSSIVALEVVSSNLNRTQLTAYSSLPSVSVAQDFEVRATAQGSNLRAWINGIQYLDTTDTTFSSGAVGFDWQAGLGQFRDVHISVNAGQSGNLVPVTLPTDFGAYCSVDDVKNLIKGIPVDDIANDDDIYQYVKDASDKINRECYISFGTGSRVEERYDGGGQFTLVLNHSPIIKLHRLQIFNNNNAIIRTWSPGSELGGDDSTDTTKLFIDKNLGTLTIPPSNAMPALINFGAITGYPTITPLLNDTATGAEYDYFNRFGRGEHNVVVDYTYGYETVPEQIRYATAKLVAALLLIKRGMKDTGGATTMTMEGLTINFMHRQGLTAPYGSYIDQWANDVQQVTKNYRRVPVLIF